MNAQAAAHEIEDRLLELVRDERVKWRELADALGLDRAAVRAVVERAADRDSARTSPGERRAGRPSRAWRIARVRVVSVPEGNPLTDPLSASISPPECVHIPEVEQGRECELCGAVFTGGQSNRRFCGDSCRRLAHRLQDEPDDPVALGRAGDADRPASVRVRLRPEAERPTAGLEVVRGLVPQARSEAGNPRTRGVAWRD